MAIGGLREKYTLGIVGSLFGIFLFLVIVVRGAYYLCKKRQWNRSVWVLERFVLPFHYMICVGVLGTCVVIPAAMDYLNQIVSVFVVWGLLSFAWINYHRRTSSDDCIDSNTSELLIPLRYFNELDEDHITVVNRHNNNSRGSLKDGVRNYFISVGKVVKQRKVRTCVGIWISLAVSLSVWILSTGLCIAAHPVTLDTWFVRRFSEDLCTRDSVCHVYFTLPEDPTTSIIVNFQSRDQPTEAFVTYSLIGQSEVYKVEATWFKLAELKEVDRYIYWAEVTGLKPGAAYSFTPTFVTFDGNHIVPHNHYKIRTVPASGNITFVQGGDMQNDWGGIELSKVAASHDPLFVLFGGDIAYANSNLHCYRRWDYWFKNWDTFMRTSQGFSVPLSLAIGNHEAGGDRLRSREDIHFYLDYFPQQLGLQKLPPKQRPLYHSHKISNHTLAIVLDSGLVEPMIGEQSRWLEHQLNKSTAANKVATYHYPLYPAVTFEQFMSEEEKQTWVGLFERYNMTVGFENHFHVFKRSKPIRNEQVDLVNGVMYLGDGAWGIDNGITGLNSRSWWIQEAQQTAHIYVVDVSEKQLQVSAYDSNNQIFSTYTKVHSQV